MAPPSYAAAALLALSWVAPGNALSAVSRVSTPSSSNSPLFESETLQLTDESLSHLAKNQSVYFDFAKNETSTLQSRTFGACKVFPGDWLWPSEWVWWLFDELLGGALIKTVPEAAPCYGSEGSFSSPICQALTSSWNNSSLRIDDPTSIRVVLSQDQTCLPPSYTPTFLYTGNKTCTVGGYPPYTANVTDVAQIQPAIKFAQVHNLRVVIKNTGQNFLAKSTRYGALNIWTHYLKAQAFTNDTTEAKTSVLAKQLKALAVPPQLFALIPELDRLSPLTLDDPQASRSEKAYGAALQDFYANTYFSIVTESDFIAHAGKASLRGY